MGKKEECAYTFFWGGGGGGGDGALSGNEMAYGNSQSHIQAREKEEKEEEEEEEEKNRAMWTFYSFSFIPCFDRFTFLPPPQKKEKEGEALG